MTEARPGTATSGPAAVLESLPLSGWHRRLVVLVGIGSFFDLYEVFLGGVLAPMPLARVGTRLGWQGGGGVVGLPRDVSSARSCCRSRPTGSAGAPCSC
ncbi:hypothetical protein [Pseudonocardia sp. ICBG601]|uniref:hypothetical protein n=1 Tax=Pseudonocardia sp. ICBG601 TaxID=2846759 RepID=UPI001CF644A4|nr:hypothetical protein [Pseudonocardia sp. ICBG601]